MFNNKRRQTQTHKGRCCKDGGGGVIMGVVKGVLEVKNELMAYDSLMRDLSGWASEYVLSLSKMVVDGRWVWHVLICEDKEGVKLHECHEVIGDTVEELRLNFLIKLAELRKERLDKIK